jgi:hypothetical protein
MTERIETIMSWLMEESESTHAAHQGAIGAKSYSAKLSDGGTQALASSSSYNLFITPTG